MILVWFFICVFSVVSDTAPLDDGSRIVGGEETTIEEFPYQVSLRYLDEHICGGSIINQNTIITAAHCTNGLSINFEIPSLPSLFNQFLRACSNYKKSFKYLEIKAGSANIEEGGQRIKIKEVIQHENFDADTYDNDLSILILSENLKLDATRAVVALEDKDVPPDTKAVVSGWGLLQEGTHDKPEILHKVEVKVIEDEECNKDYGGQITSAMLCANAPGKDACQGDSGGPLVSRGKLIGVVSWGEGCADFQYPGVYAKISKLLPWIRSHVDNVTT